VVVVVRWTRAREDAACQSESVFSPPRGRRGGPVGLRRRGVAEGKGSIGRNGDEGVRKRVSFCRVFAVAAVCRLVHRVIKIVRLQVRRDLPRHRRPCRPVS